MGQTINTYIIFIGKAVVKSTLGSRWEGNIKMNLKKLGGEIAEWIKLAQYMAQWWVLINMAMHLRVP
jgi:hypothetical protein